MVPSRDVLDSVSINEFRRPVSKELKVRREAVLHVHAALTDPRRGPAIEPKVAADAKAVIQILMDMMETNRRFRPAATADVRPHIRRIYELPYLAITSTPGSNSHLGLSLPRSSA